MDSYHYQMSFTSHCYGLLIFQLDCVWEVLLADYNDQVIKSTMFMWPKITFVHEMRLKMYLFSNVAGQEWCRRQVSALTNPLLLAANIHCLSSISVNENNKLYFFLSVQWVLPEVKTRVQREGIWPCVSYNNIHFCSVCCCWCCTVL